MRNLKALIAYEAKRRPEIAALVERAASLSDEDIENADVPLPWYRKALRQLRDEASPRGHHQEALTAEMLDALNDDSNYTTIESDNATVGQVYKYNGPTFFHPCGGWEVEVGTGELFFASPQGVVWVGESKLERPRSQLNESSLVVSAMSREDYIVMRQKELMAKHGVSQPVEGMEELVAGFNPVGYDERRAITTSGVSYTIKRHKP